MKQNPPFYFQRFIKRAILGAWHNILRNKLLSLATIFIISLMLFVFNLVLALSFVSDSVIENVGKKLDIGIELNEGIDEQSIQAFLNNLKDNPKIKDIVYVSKEEAFEKFGQKYPNIITFLERNHLSNPLPDTVRLVTQDLKDNNDIISLLEGPEFSQVVNQESLMKNQDQKQRNEKILAITTSIKNTSIWLIIIFALVGVMIIFNSININIHTHEREIQIMKLVGAKYSFIRSGFILEGVAFALSALLISLAISRLVLAYLAKNLVGIITNETLMAGLNAILVHFQDNFWLTLGWQLLIALMAGILSSYLAIELYLRKEHSF